MANTGAYASGPGHMPDVASIDHERYLLESGIYSTHADIVVALLDLRGEHGLTCKELTEHPSVPAGLRNSRSASAVLTNLYAEGTSARLLDERRFNNGVYVLPQHVGDRPTKPYRPAHSRIWTEQEVAFCTTVVRRFQNSRKNDYENILFDIAKKILAETVS